MEKGRGEGRGNVLFLFGLLYRSNILNALESVNAKRSTSLMHSSIKMRSSVDVSEDPCEGLPEVLHGVLSLPGRCALRPSSAIGGPPGPPARLLVLPAVPLLPDGAAGAAGVAHRALRLGRCKNRGPCG